MESTNPLDNNFATNFLKGRRLAMTQDDTETPPTTPTPSLGQQYLNQIETWRVGLLHTPGNPRSTREGYHSFIQVELHVIADQHGRKDLIPLIDARYSIRPEFQHIRGQRTLIGSPIEGTTLRVEGAMEGCSLNVVDEERNIGQTMVRLLVVRPTTGKLFILDVYSDPQMDVMDGKPDADHRLNWDSCLPSRAERIVRCCRDNNYVVLGWIPIKEINEGRLPRYDR